LSFRQFFVRRFNGNPGTQNSLRVVSLKHVLAPHGSPTAVMEYAGWMVGRTTAAWRRCSP
jgi:hypothetical protein